MLTAVAATAPVPAVPAADGPDMWTVSASRPTTVATSAVDDARPGLVQRIERLLTGLGATAGEVAATLAAATPSVAGWPGDADMDPLCRWLGSQEPGLLVWLTGDHVHAEQLTDNRVEIALVPLPGPVAAFRAACAGGDHHDLWLPARAATDDVAIGPGPAGWALAFPGAGPAEWRTTTAGPPPAAAAAPDPDRSLADAGPGGGRGLAHTPYADAVGHALELRGVPVHACHVAPPSGDDDRCITLTLDPDLTRARWPGHAGVLLRWSERAGWRLLPQHGGQVDLPHALVWWDARRSGPAGPVLPAPDRLAAWVATLITGTPARQVEATLRSADTDLLPAWRAAWPAGGEPAFESALDAYRTHPGHRHAHPTTDPTLGGPSIDDHR